MSNVIKPKRGSTDPIPGILAEGEIGINTSAATAFVGVAGGGSKKLNAGNSETADAVNSTGEATANRNRHIWFSDTDDEKKRAYNDNFQYNPSTNTISSNVSGTSSNVTGIVDFAHGGTGRSNRDSGYSALMSGGVYKGDLNNAQNAGVYLFSTTETINYPIYAGRTDTWARLEVTTSARDSAEVMQRVVYTTEGVEFTRLHGNGTTWTPWKIVVSGAVAHRQFVQSIPSGADLNNYMANGSYVSYLSENVIANLPPYYSNGKGSFTLIVTGIGVDSAYTNQILIALDNKHVYMRAQTNWKEPWIWTDWTQVITTNIGGDYYAQLKSPNNLIHAGNEFTFAAPQFSNDIWLNYRTSSGNTDGNIGTYLFGNGKGGLAPIKASGIYADTLGWRTLWSGKLTSGSIKITGAMKYAAILVSGHPGSEAYRTHICLPTGNIDGQMVTNMVYMYFVTRYSGDDCTITLKSNPSNGDIDYVWGIVQWKG